jgi:RNA polymerase sigma factor (sigma-70 family)
MAVHGIAIVDADEQLLVGARAGDQDCFARLIEPHIAAGYRLAASMLNDAGEAEDVVQEATFRAWKAVGQLSSSSRIRPWFLSIVANRSRSVRSTRRWSMTLTSQAGQSQEGPAEEVDTRADLVNALRRLSPDERAAVFLRFYEDMSSHEIGEVLRISATAVRSRLHRALRRLRVDLTEEEM